MSPILFALLLAPAAGREPVGPLDPDRIEAPLERRLASLLAGEAVLLGSAAIVPLYARVPSEAGHGRRADAGWAGEDLRARSIVDDGRCYLRIVNRGPEPILLAAGTVFFRDGVEVAVARDAVIPVDYAALIPGAPLDPTRQEGYDLALEGALPPRATGALLAGLPAFGAEMGARALRGESSYLAVLRGGPVVACGDGLLALLKPAVRGFDGTAVGAVFLVGDRPVAAQVFARHDLFVHALPGLLRSFAVAVRDEEIAVGREALSRLRPSPVEARHQAIGWLRALAREKAEWNESYGSGFETVILCPTHSAVGHAVVDQQRALIHAAFYATPIVPDELRPGGQGPAQPPRPPGTPDETPTGFRERRPRPTVEDQRRADRGTNVGPQQPPPSAPGAGGPGPGATDPSPPRDDPAPARPR